MSVQTYCKIIEYYRRHVTPCNLVEFHVGYGCESSCLQMQGSRVRFPGTTKKKVVGLERGPLSLVSTTEELLDRKVAAPV
jgi:hypothetical protein